MVDEKTTKQIGVGLKIRVLSTGEYEIVGAENMDRKIVDTIKNAIDLALSIYAEGGRPDKYTGGAKTASLDDAEAREYRKAAEECFKKLQPFLPDKFNPLIADPDFQDPKALRTFQTYVGWHRIMPKNGDNTFNLSGVGPVSDIRPRRYADAAGSASGTNAGGGYADEAIGLYRKLMDGMGQFHEGRKKVTYHFAA